MQICADVSRTTKRFSAQDIFNTQSKAEYWSAYEMRLTFTQIYHVMAGAPYLNAVGMWQRSTEYEFVEEFREYAVPPKKRTPGPAYEVVRG